MSYLVRISVRRHFNDPADAGEPLREAQGLFRRFHCFDAPRVLRRHCRRMIPDVLVNLGDLNGVIYRSDRGQCGQPRTFVHFFKTPAQLSCDARGTQLYIQGGRYLVTPRGIEG